LGAKRHYKKGMSSPGLAACSGLGEWDIQTLKTQEKPEKKIITAKDLH
jgi:hypothetical protein